MTAGNMWPRLSGLKKRKNKKKKKKNTHANVYGAVIMTKAIARVHPVHLMNVDSAPLQVTANSQTTPTNLGGVSATKWLLPSTSTIAIYYYSGRKLIFTLPSDGRWKAELTCTAVRVWYSPTCPRLYIAVVVVINTTVRGEIRTSVLSHRGQACHH